MNNTKKKTTNSVKSQEKTVSVISDTTIREAIEVVFVAQDDTFLLKKLNTILLVNYIKESLSGTSLSQGDLVTISLYGKPSIFKVAKATGVEEDLLAEVQEQMKDEIKLKLLITKKTLINIIDVEKKVDTAKEDPSLAQMKPISKPKDQEDDQIIVAGLDKEITQLIEIIKNLSRETNHQGILGEFLNVKGVLIYGPSGVGKTVMVKHVGSLLPDVKFFLINTREILSKYVGESEKKIVEIFQQAKKYKPCVLFFDDIHIICNKKEVGNENSFLIINTLLQEIDSLTPHDKTLVLIATNQVTSLDNSLRRAGRFDKDIKIEVPNATNRLKILKTYIEKIPNNLSTEDIKDISENTNGFTGADIMTLLRESLLKGFSLKAEEKMENKTFEPKTSDDLKLTKQSIDDSIEDVNPSGLKDLLLEIPKVLWSDIGGYGHVKEEIKRVTEWPLKHPDSYVRMGIKPSRGILLYGPPGCSKTMIAKAIASESKLNFIAVKGPEIFSKYVGDSEKAIRDLFKRARLCAPSVIFFDEIDAIATQRSINTDVSERVLTQLLIEMDGVESLKHVIVIAATNRPDSLDIALLRPGRFDHLIYISLPDLECRREILRLNIIGNNMPRENDVVIEDLALLTEGYTGAETCMIVREAGMKALSRDLHNAKVEKDDFLYSLKKIRPRITKDTIKYYEDFAKNSKLI